MTNYSNGYAPSIRTSTASCFPSVSRKRWAWRGDVAWSLALVAAVVATWGVLLAAVAR